MTVMTNDEIFSILQEECAEVIQAISKCRRFGMDTNYAHRGTNRQLLEAELGDVLAMIDLLIKNDEVNKSVLEIAKINKMEKLRRWSTIEV